MSKTSPSVIEMLPLEAIHPYQNNPRVCPTNAIDAVAASIEQLGFRNPIIVDKNNEIICGHTRYQAATKLGLSKVPCIKVTDLSEKDVIALRVLDNKTGELSRWDFDLLKLELEQVDLTLEVFELSYGHMELDSILNTGNQEEEEEVGAPAGKKGVVKKAIYMDLGQYAIFKKVADIYRGGDKDLTDAECLIGIADQWFVATQGEDGEDVEESA